MAVSKGITLRPSTAADAAQLLSLYRAVAATPGGLARLPFEITPSYVQGFLDAAIARGVGLVAVADAEGCNEEESRGDGKIVGEIHAVTAQLFCFSHVLSDLTIAVDPGFQGRGLGRSLFEAFLNTVDEQRPHISRVELIARESNARALSFYESLGFVREGELRGRILNADGSLESDIPMARLKGGQA